MEASRHTFYIVASYGMLALAVVVELIALRQRRAKARRRLSSDEFDDDR
ncbi:MAG: heme exporter protein CcmD [Burkholderiaceae bacterium]